MGRPTSSSEWYLPLSVRGEAGEPNAVPVFVTGEWVGTNTSWSVQTETATFESCTESLWSGDGKNILCTFGANFKQSRCRAETGCHLKSPHAFTRIARGHQMCGQSKVIDGKKCVCTTHNVDSTLNAPHCVAQKLVRMVSCAHRRPSRQADV